MTNKQKWFENKLMNEIEAMLTEADREELRWSLITNWGAENFDTYKVSVKEASEDIDRLLKMKALIADGKSLDEARTATC